MESRADNSGGSYAQDWDKAQYLLQDGWIAKGGGVVFPAALAIAL